MTYLPLNFTIELTMYTLNDYCRETFGEKLYKISLNGGFTCPNRDGTLGSRGCIFCSAGGSGDFAEDPHASIAAQIEAGKKKVEKKMKSGGHYIAYFQAYTNTYAPLEKLEALFTAAISHPDVRVLSVATRPDCLPEETVALLARLNRIKPVWVELGLQTIHEESARYIRRGYPLAIYEDALRRLKEAGLTVITHVILGLPGETREDMLETIKYLAKGIPSVCAKSLPAAPKPAVPNLQAARLPQSISEAFHFHTDGIKLQLLHVLKNTDLAKDYLAGRFSVMTLEEYLPLLADCVRRLPPDMVVHRITGDGPKSLLLAPLWTGNKRLVLNAITRYLKEEQVQQGELFPAD